MHGIRNSAAESHASPPNSISRPYCSSQSVCRRGRRIHMPRPKPELATATSSTVPPATILVVDDSPVNLQILVRTLNGTGHRILAATAGKSALEIAVRTHPDLILLDVMMPGMDGFEVCRA